MKGIAIFLAVAGIIAAVVGIYGFIMLNSSNYPAGTYDLVADMGTQMGLNSYLSPGQAIDMFITRNRVILLVAGVAALAVSIPMFMLTSMRKKKKA